MAVSYQQLWEEQKKKNPYMTLSNAGAVKTTGSGANVVSAASANLGAGKARPSGANVVSSASADLGAGRIKPSSAASDAYKELAGSQAKPGITGLYNSPALPKATAAANLSFAADPNIKAAGSDIAIKAYQQRLAAQQAEREETAEEETNNSVPIVPPVVPPNQGILDEEEDPYELELEERLQAILDAQNAKYDALIAALRGQSGALNAQYDANAANLYELYRRGQLVFPELMSGTATGMADSFALENNLNFQNNLNDNELARAAALQALQTQVNQYQADAELQAAQTAADWAKMMYQQRVKDTNDTNNTAVDAVDPWADIQKNGAFVRGFGRMTAAELQAAIAEGLIEVYEENGKLFFRKVG